MHTFLSIYFMILFLSFLQVFLQKLIVIAKFDESAEITTAHFADSKRGRMSWIIDENALPWTGQYYYIESKQSPMTNLLVVVDSSNGNHLGICASYAPRDNKWRRFFWILTEESLICNITDTETTISKIHFPSISSPRTFSLRILAQQGPKCFRDMIIQNEKLEGCPPKLQRNLFHGMSLECNCPIPEMNAHMRNGIAPFHFVNPIITSSNGNLSISHDFSPSLSKNTDNLNPIKAIAEIMPRSTSIITTANTTTITTTVIENTEMSITTKESVNLPLDSQQNNKLLPSIIQESHVSIATHELLSSSTLAPLASLPSATANIKGINEQTCAGIQCQNNGTCVTTNDGRVICVCSEGFLGSHCEINLCANVQCMHNGVCQTNGNVPHCLCQPGTTGTFCEQNVCNPKCEQGGICKLTGNMPVCQCPTGTFGINCNIIDTCTSNSGACTEYNSDARCQLDSDNFALISPIPVNATYKCLCLNERSEWIDCKELPRKVHIPIMQTVITTTMSIPNIITSVLVPETPEQPRSTQQIASQFHNHPHFSNLFPNPFLPSPTTNMTTTITASSPINPNADFRQPSESGMETSSALNRSMELLPVLHPTIPEPSRSTLFNTTTHTANLPAISTLLITPKSPSQLHNLFNITPKSSRPQTISTSTVALPEHPEFKDLVNTTGQTAEISLNPTEKNFGEMSNKFENENFTVESPLLPSIEEFPATSSLPEMIIDNTSHIPLSTFSGFITNMPPILISTTAIIDEDSVIQISSFTPDTPEIEGSILVSKTSDITEDGNLPDRQVFTTTTFSSTSKTNEKEGMEEEDSFAKSTEKVEETTITVGDLITEAGQSFDEDEVKFVRLTAVFPTTTLIPDLNQPSDGAFSDNNDTTRSDTSSWTIVFVIISVLMVLAGACVTLIFRYVRRSRKLHGKYNPAREESILSSSYSMPMATVTKEERLI
ncbi:putative integral membrane protein [Brugia pahangi]